MSFLDTQSQAWDSAHWEFSLVFEDFADEDLWRRADPQLLSVGELVAHVVYSQITYANQLGGQISSPLSNKNARYYLTTVDNPVESTLGVEEVVQELDRVQKAVKEIFMSVDKGRDDALPFRGPGRTFGEFADDMLFHVAYHTGQAFSVRHLMGHKTNDN
jgi:hypothetical protein